MNAVVVANFKADGIEMIPGFQHTGTWWDYFTGEAFDVGDINSFMPFEAGEYRVFVDEELNFPASLEELTTLNTALSTIAYPNPTSDACTWVVPFDLQKPFDFRVFNSLGQSVLHDVSYATNRNKNAIDLHFKGLEPNVYYLHLIQGGQSYSTHVQKLQ
jgi:hypothetical protein